MDKMIHNQPLRQRRRMLGLALSVVLALLFISALLFGLRPATPALAEPATLYVDAAGGADSPTCGTMSDPCQTISYTLGSRANSGDTLLLATGTYTENLTLQISVTIRGGYDPADWTQTGWTTIDGSGNGLLRGEWDGEGVRFPSVIFDDGAYQMWYDGEDFDGVRRIGYATSPDGVQWTRHVTPVLDVGQPGEWDEAYLEAPFVIKESDTSYKMWYSGWAHGSDAQIGYATSSDGIQWTKHPDNPVLSPGSEEWNNRGVLQPMVMQVSDVYVMYLTAVGDGDGGLRPYIAYAVSPDGIEWQMEADNALFGRSWEMWLWRPYVQQKGGSYKMWYSAYANEGLVTYATSTDGLDWKKWGAGMLSGTPGEWDEGSAIDPWVLPTSGVGYQMWYDNGEAIGVAASINGIEWTKPYTTPVFTGGVKTGYRQPVIRVDNDAAQVVLDGRLVLRGGAGEQAGGVQAGGARVTIRGCIIRDNFADGAPQSTAGGGVAGNWLTLEDSWIVNNRVTQGAGGVRAYGTLVMTNTVVASNLGDFGIHLNGSAALMNVTMVNNRDGLLFNSTLSDTLTIVNSILYGNGGPAISAAVTDTIQVSYSDIEGGWAGEGNIDLDPRFFDLATDQRLMWDSPCVDSGTQNGAPDHDIDGNLRPQDGDLDGEAFTDMGAYERLGEHLQNYLPFIRR